MYFPNCSIFKAKVSSGSFVWKSILKARKVITMGPKWHVSDGLSIQIYGESVCLVSKVEGCYLLWQNYQYILWFQTSLIRPLGARILALLTKIFSLLKCNILKKGPGARSLTLTLMIW